MAPGAEWVTCGYCRVSSFVQRARSRTAAEPAIPAGTPVIHVPRGRGFIWGALVLVVLSTVVIAAVAFEQNERLANVAVQMPPLLFDVNDDGAEDALIVALKTGGATRHLRALDAATGATLWKTDDLGADVENVALVDDVVLWITSSKLRGFDARTGRERFAGDLPERATGVCEVGRSWLLLTADKKAHAVDPSTGALTPRSIPLAPGAAQREPVCAPASSTFGGYGRLVQADSSPRVVPDGMTISSVLHFGAETLPALAFGRRTQGSAVPMLAGLQAERALWKLELPSSAPLEVEAGDPTAVTIAASRAYASYQRTSTPGFTVTAVMLSNGQRVWEAVVPRGRNARIVLRASDRHVFAGADTSLYALSVTDGRVLWRVGWDPGAE